ncbi:MAG: DUF1302 family protein [Pseudomonadota bacterium]
MNSVVYFSALLAVMASSLTMTSGFAIANELSGLLSSQTAYAREQDELQQQEWLVDLDYRRNLPGGGLTAILRLRWDSVDTLNPQSAQRPASYSNIGGPLVTGAEGIVDLRELYWEHVGNSVYWRIGKQQIVWGEADGLTLLDVINPQSFREFIVDDADDSRISLWMLNAEINLSNSAILQALWIVDSSSHELAPASSAFAFTSPSQVPAPPDGSRVIVNQAQAPATKLANSDIGLRFSDFVSDGMGSWDYSLNYLYHYVDTPVARLRQQADTLVVDQDYERSHLLGGSLSTARSDWTLRAEFAYESNRFQRTTAALPGVAQADQWGSLIGLDWQGWSDQFISLQWLQTTVSGEASTLINAAQEDTLSFLWESTFLNATVSAQWLHIHSLDYHDGVAQLLLRYNYSSALDLYLGADIFYGDNAQLYGQFDQADRLAIGLRLGF